LEAELANVAQASVNPKAETVEELQRRRKGLHLGMCKLLREDLSIMAEIRAAVNDQEVRMVPTVGHANLATRTLLQVAILAHSILAQMGYMGRRISGLANSLVWVGGECGKGKCFVGID
jgi:hypothetical protein